MDEFPLSLPVRCAQKHTFVSFSHLMDRSKSREDLAAARVLLVDTLSGTNDYSVSLVESLASKLDLTVFTVRNTPLRSSPACTVIRGFPEYGGNDGHLLKVVRQLRGLLVLIRELWRHRRAVVHVQFLRLRWVELPLYLAFRALGGKLILTAHNALPHETSSLDVLFNSIWYRLISRFHVLTAHTGATLARQFGVRKERIDVIPHGNYQLFKMRSTDEPVTLCRADFGVSASDVLFLFFGLIRTYKGVDLLVEAFASLDPSLNTKLIIAGDGDADLVEDLRQLISARKLGSRVLVEHRRIPDAELSSLLRMADVVVFPYRHISQSGALLLAMTYGKAIIASRLPGFSEYLEEGREAIFFEASNSDDLFAAMCRLASDSAFRESIGAAACWAAYARYSWESISERLIEVYSRTLDSNRDSSRQMPLR